eukprot:scaffold4603_cov128-Skeletonema_dohrnii-CCMP3373.AAC.2
MNVCISNESQIQREVEVINQDIHAVCKFHQVCEWEINVVVGEASLTTLFEEAASWLPSYVHLYTKVHSKSFNKFTFVGERQRPENHRLPVLEDVCRAHHDREDAVAQTHPLPGSNAILTHAVCTTIHSFSTSGCLPGGNVGYEAIQPIVHAAA